MFGLFKKRNQEIERKNALYNSVRAYYEGEVDSADYWDPENPEDFKGGIITPDGEGKITFKIKDEIKEQYQGSFQHGAYDGWGKLIRNGKKYQGWFSNGKYIGKTQNTPD